MIGFKGGAMVSPMFSASFGGAVGYFLTSSGNTWLGIAFSILSVLSLMLLAATLMRFSLNFKRTPNL